MKIWLNAVVSIMNIISPCLYFMLCVTVAMRDLHFLSSLFSGKPAITDLCKSFSLFLPPLSRMCNPTQNRKTNLRINC